MTLQRLLEKIADQWESDFGDLTDWPVGTFEELAEYIDIFPMLLSLLWSLTGLLSLVHNLVRRRRPIPPELPGYTVLIPFYAEAGGALNTARSLVGVMPPPDRIVLIDDGSPADESLGAELEAAVAAIPGAELLRLPRNAGKAGALNAAFASVTSELVVCLDADTIVLSRDWRVMLARFVARPELGALTGKIRPSDTGSLVERFQALDYLAVIGLVKHAECEWGGLMTVSGALAVFRREALVSCGGWNSSTPAEDIDISWQLQSRGWRLGFEPTWVAEVEMVPGWPALWRQRQRWSRGLGHTIRDHALASFGRVATHLPVVFMVLVTGGWLWSSLVMGIVRAFSALGALLHGEMFYFGALFQQGLVYFGICLAFFTVQLLIAEILDRRPGVAFLKLLPLVPFYPLYFAFISLSSFVVGFPRGFLRLDGGRWQRTVRLGEVQAATRT